MLVLYAKKDVWRLWKHNDERFKTNNANYGNPSFYGSIGKFQKTRGLRKKKRMNFVGAWENSCEYQDSYKHKIEYNRSDSKWNISTDEVIPVDPLLVFSCIFKNVPLKALKDVGCNTKVVSLWFERIWKSFRMMRRKCVLQQSIDSSAGAPLNVIFNRTSHIGPHIKTSNWVVAYWLSSWGCHHMLQTVQKYTIETEL